ncbi:hypothetical protein D3870_11915 [Noviherbaspirillum cavernae]|uniref:DUF2116 family Zn-ribbon domain-containing protein n=1 Tax=Noviherbaspirillum cavernae TaxID=2320862 RepID=A0A418X2E8_9BURK|nr:hypothetical protein D3870_11915 [Noviherbaspirillum cavernae]
MNHLQHAEHRIAIKGRKGDGECAPTPSFADLKPKGACWYCNQPLDNVRRFCNKACADDYRTEEAFAS